MKKKNASWQITLSEDEVYFLRVTTSHYRSYRSLIPVVHSGFAPGTSPGLIPVSWVHPGKMLSTPGGLTGFLITVEFRSGLLICSSYHVRPDCSQGITSSLCCSLTPAGNSLKASELRKSCPVLRIGFFQSFFIITQLSPKSIRKWNALCFLLKFYKFLICSRTDLFDFTVVKRSIIKVSMLISPLQRPVRFTSTLSMIPRAVTLAPPFSRPLHARCRSAPRCTSPLLSAVPPA